MTCEPRKELSDLGRLRESEEVQQKTSGTKGSAVGTQSPKKGSLARFTSENAWRPLVLEDVITASRTRYVIYFPAICDNLNRGFLCLIVYCYLYSKCLSTLLLYTKYFSVQ